MMVLNKFIEILRIKDHPVSAIRLRTEKDRGDKFSWFMTGALNNSFTDKGFNFIVTMACCMRLNTLDHTLSWSGINPDVNYIFTPLTYSNIFGSEVMVCHSDKALTIWWQFESSADWGIKRVAHYHYHYEQLFVLYIPVLWARSELILFRFPLFLEF